MGDKYCATGKDWKMLISLSVTNIRHSVTHSRDVTKEEELNSEQPSEADEYS